MSSNKKQFAQIPESTAKTVGVTALADRPNDASRYGQGGLRAEELKKWFDNLPNTVRKSFNELVSMLATSDAAKYIGIDALDKDNLYDFLLLFGERGTGLNDKNISDYIQTLYTPEDESTEKSMALKAIVEDIVERIVSAKADITNLEVDKLNRIDLEKHKNGDPNDPNLEYEIGTYAAIYVEYFGADSKWRSRLLRANQAAYANKTDEKVQLFKDNLLISRIPITDSNGRLSVAAPQKGKSGQYHYYNPDASAATNNAYNMAVPLWYGDERYVKAGDYSSDKSALDKQLESLAQTAKNAFDEVRYNSTTGELSFSAPDGSVSTVDLPLELIVRGGSFNDATKDIELSLASGEKLTIPLDIFAEKIANDIAGINNAIKRAFNNAELTPEYKLLLSHDDIVSLSVDLSGIAFTPTAKKQLNSLVNADLDGRITALEESQGDLSTILEQLNKGEIE